MRRVDPAKALDECLNRIYKGDSVEACLVEYPNLRKQLESLLSAALLISARPKVEPSDEYRRLSKSRLMSQLREMPGHREVVKQRREATSPGILERILGRLARGLSRPRTLAVPVTLLLLLAIGGSLSVIVSLGFPSTPTVLISQCTLSIVSGEVELQTPGSNIWQQAADGIILEAGIRVKTASSSHAMLTFFEGSSIKLEPNTDIEIQRLERVEGRSTDIVLKQWIGTTWSRVVKQLGPGTRYEIHTPSAIALVRGTLFETEVDETAKTTVSTTQGVVSLSAQNEEVLLPAGLQASVEYGATPSAPQPIPLTGDKLVIDVSMPAVASVSDPTGSSIGYLPGGFEFNQITGAQSTSQSGGIQVITIPNPIDGDYSAALRCATGGSSQVNLYYFSSGEPVFTYKSTYEVTDNSDWLIPFHLVIEDGQFISASVGDIEPMGHRMPEKLPTPEALETLLPQTTQTASPSPSPETGREYTLVVIGGNGGAVTKPGQGIFFYPAGAVVELLAVPDDGWRFVSWTGGVADSSSPATNITLLLSEVITANFAPRH